MMSALSHSGTSGCIEEQQIDHGSERDDAEEEEEEEEEDVRGGFG